LKNFEHFLEKQKILLHTCVSFICDYLGIEGNLGILDNVFSTPKRIKWSCKWSSIVSSGGITATNHLFQWEAVIIEPYRQSPTIKLERISVKKTTVPKKLIIEK
jgi:hypothetical protein